MDCNCSESTLTYRNSYLSGEYINNENENLWSLYDGIRAIYLSRAGTKCFYLFLSYLRNWKAFLFRKIIREKNVVVLIHVYSRALGIFRSVFLWSNKPTIKSRGKQVTPALFQLFHNLRLGLWLHGHVGY